MRFVIGSPRPAAALRFASGHVRAFADAGGRLPWCEALRSLRSSGGRSSSLRSSSTRSLQPDAAASAPCASGVRGSRWALLVPLLRSAAHRATYEPSLTLPVARRCTRPYVRSAPRAVRRLRSASNDSASRETCIPVYSPETELQHSRGFVVGEAAAVAECRAGGRRGGTRLNAARGGRAQRGRPSARGAERS